MVEVEVALLYIEGLVIQTRVHGAKVPDRDGIGRLLLEPARPRLGAGYRDRGKEWTERSLGAEVEVVNRSPKPPPERSLGETACGLEHSLRRPPE